MDFGGWVDQVERALLTEGQTPDGRRQNNKRFCSQKGIRTKSSKSSRKTLSVASSLNDDFLKCGSVALSLSFTRHFVKLDSGNRRSLRSNCSIPSEGYRFVTRIQIGGDRRAMPPWLQLDSDIDHHNWKLLPGNRQLKQNSRPQSM